MNNSFFFNRVPYFLTVFLIGFSLFVGIRGVDFGNHWDEWKLVSSVETHIKKKTFLPGWYNYPSMSYWLTLASAYTCQPDVLLAPEQLPEAELKPFYLRGRTFFLIFSVMAIGLVFLTLLELGVGSWAALGGAALLAGSWEYGYHARWMAPDAIMATLATACLLFLMRFYRTSSERWAWLAAIFGGLALGSKYPAGLLIIILLVAIVLNWYAKIKRWSGILASAEAKSADFIFPQKPVFPLKTVLLASFLFFAAFLLSTPGALLDFTKFKADLLFEIAHYKTGQDGHNVSGAAEHLGNLFRYFGFHVFSPNKLLSLFLALVSLSGVLFSLKRDRRLALVLGLFPLLYMIYFSSQKVMFARNYLVLIPFSAIYFGLALSSIATFTESILIQRRPRKENQALEIPPKKISATQLSAAALPLLIVLVLAGFNLTFAYKASDTIRRKDDLPFFAKKVDLFVRSHPGQKYLFSTATTRFWNGFNLGEFPKNVYFTRDQVPGQDFEVIFFSRESELYPRKLEANHYDYVTHGFGAMEINLNYYPRWSHTKILVMKWKYAKKLAIQGL